MPVPPVRVQGPPDPTAVGHVYVNDNTAGTNTIAGYDRQSNGALTGSLKVAPTRSQGSRSVPTGP
jgi:hypothetical protein